MEVSSPPHFALSPACQRFGPDIERVNIARAEGRVQVDAKLFVVGAELDPGHDASGDFGNRELLHGFKIQKMERLDTVFVDRVD